MNYSGSSEVVWDETKNRSNRRKHGVSFEEVRELFLSAVERLEVFDSEHSSHEEGFLTIGPTRCGLLVVVFAEPDEDVVRVISARLATKGESALFRIAMGNRG